MNFIVIFYRISQGVQWCAKNLHPTIRFFGYLQEGIFGGIFKMHEGLKFDGVRKGQVYSRLTQFHTTNLVVMSILAIGLCIFWPSLRGEVYDVVMSCFSYDLMRGCFCC